jgi:hypothetical protein
MRVLDRSHLYPGQVVGSASDIAGQIGIVTGVTTLLDLAEHDNRGIATGVIKGVSPSSLRRVRSLNLGDFVVYGPWLGRIVEVCVDVDILFDDGAICRVANADPEILLEEDETGHSVLYRRAQMNCEFHPGQSVQSTCSSLLPSLKRHGGLRATGILIASQAPSSRWRRPAFSSTGLPPSTVARTRRSSSHPLRQHTSTLMT